MNDKGDAMIDIADLMQSWEDNGLNLMESYRGGLTAILTGVLSNSPDQWGDGAYSKDLINSCMKEAQMLANVLKTVKMEIEN